MCKISRENSKWLLRKWQSTLGDTFFAAHCRLSFRGHKWDAMQMLHNFNTNLMTCGRSHNNDICLRHLSSSCDSVKLLTRRCETDWHYVSSTFRRTVVVMWHVGVAAVELQHIDAPVSNGLRVKLVMIECTRKSSTRVTADVFIHAQLQAFRMYLQHQRLIQSAYNHYETFRERSNFRCAKTTYS